ncbi:recombinase family protein [Rhodococcus marinonascens]|uniref:recombinase family protein n=1 Tax=Rhodococcus marinonascens TaxID=38311 RepID=UPI000932D3E0|nr:recombinase family protein [Rhodococcus marinonascens]
MDKTDILGPQREGNGSKLGYCQVFTGMQNADLQLDALRAAGCWRVWTDQASGAKQDRPELQKLFEHLRPGDTRRRWVQRMQWMRRQE